MSRSSARRGQVEPTAALAATAAVVVGLSLYAGVLADAAPGRTERNLARPALERVHDAVAPAGAVARPALVSGAVRAGPDGYRVNVSLTVADGRWCAGPAVPPGDADTAARPTSVRVGPGRVRPGRLRVAVWA